MIYMGQLEHRNFFRMNSQACLVELEKKLVEISGAIFVIDRHLDLKKKAEQECHEAIESGDDKEIEALKSSMDEGKISALIKVRL